jgi:hypothetical protein
MSVPRKLIQLALVDLHHNERTTDDKWFNFRFDFNDRIEFTIGELHRAVNEYGPVKAKVSNGNETGIHLRVKAMKTDLMTFVFLSSSKDSQLEEPATNKGEAWTQALEVLEAIVDSVLQTLRIKTFIKQSASPETLSQTCNADRCASTTCN